MNPVMYPAVTETTGDMKTQFLKGETSGNIPAAGVADRLQVVAVRHVKEGSTMDRVNVDKAGIVLGVFLSAVYVLGIAFVLLYPSAWLYGAWAKLFPEFVWLTPGSFIFGLFASFTYGFAFAFIVWPIYKFLVVLIKGKQRYAGLLHPGPT